MSTLTLIAGVEAENVQLKLSSAKMPENLRLSVVENRNSVIDKLLNRLSDKVANQAQLKLRYGNDSRAVLDGEKEIEYTRDAIAKEKELITDSVTRGPNTGRHKLQGIIIAQQAKIASLRAENQQTSAQLSEVGEKLRNLDAKEMGIHRLEREIDRLERDWMLYTKNYGEAKIFEEMDLAKIANIAVISRPASSLKPVAPKLKLILLGSLIMGFGAPIAWVLFTDFLRPVVRSRDDVASLLGAPVLARIPEARKS